MGKWVISAALLAILAIAFWASYGLWIRVVASVPAWVWLLLAIGGGLSVVLGAGLMALVFYSNRMGFDEPPVIVEPGNEFSPLTAMRERDRGRSRIFLAKLRESCILSASSKIAFVDGRVPAERALARESRDPGATR